MRLHHILVALCALLLCSCASGYGPNAGMGGVDAKMIGPGEGVIVVSGNGFTSAQRVQDMLMLKAAEMTKEAGHQRFTLLTIEDQGALDATKQGRLAEYIRDKARSTTSGPSLIKQDTVLWSKSMTTKQTRFGGGFFVVMFKDAAGVFDATAVARDAGSRLNKKASEIAKNG